MSCVIQWKEFTIANEDVQDIKTRLISNPKGPHLSHNVKRVRACIDYMQKLSLDVQITGIPDCFPEKVFSQCKKGLEEAREQIGASAICVAIYITAKGSAKAKTKLTSMRTAETLLTNLKIHCPLKLMSRWSAEVSRLEAEEKEDMENESKKDKQKK